MNRVVQYVVPLTGVGNTPVRVAVPLAVPDKLAFRIRRVQFRIQTMPNSDRDYLMGLSMVNRQPIIGGGVAGFISSPTFIAFAAAGVEISGTAGIGVVKLDHVVDLWDYDYQLVMPPTFHLLTVTSADAVICAVYGEMVPVSTGKRNAIIATQGGLW